MTNGLHGKVRQGMTIPMDDIDDAHLPRARLTPHHDQRRTPLPRSWWYRHPVVVLLSQERTPKCVLVQGMPGWAGPQRVGDDVLPAAAAADGNDDDDDDAEDFHLTMI